MTKSWSGRESVFLKYLVFFLIRLLLCIYKFIIARFYLLLPSKVYNGTVISGLDCGTPNVSDTAIQYGNKTLFGDIISFECKRGLKSGNGSHVIQCTSSGVWNDTSVVCSRSSCGPPDMNSNTNITGNSYLYKDNVTYSCDEGYFSNGGNVIRTCEHTTNWTGSALTCERKYIHPTLRYTLPCRGCGSRIHVSPFEGHFCRKCTICLNLHAFRNLRNFLMLSGLCGSRCRSITLSNHSLDILVDCDAFQYSKVLNL